MKPDLNEEGSQLRHLALILTTLALVIPLASLVGWISGIQQLASYGDSFIPMAPSTAFGFLLLSISLLMVLRGASDKLAHCGAYLAGILVAAYGFLVFVAWISGWPVNPDEMLFRDLGTLGAHRVGRMAHSTAVLLVLSGISVAAFAWSHIRVASAGSWLSLAVFSGAAVALSGMVFAISYYIGDPLLYRGSAIPMALPTAISFLLLGGSLTTTAIFYNPALRRWYQTLDDMSIGVQLRLGMGFILALVIAMGALAWLQTNQIWLQTKNLHDHPLTVSRALGAFEHDILSMRLSMKDLALGEDSREIAATLPEIEAYQADAERQFDVLFDSYLGPRADIAELQDAFVRWNAIRAETIRLHRAGKAKEAAARSSHGGIGNLQAEKVMLQYKKIDAFARNKTDEFYRNAEELNHILNRDLVVIVAFILLLTLLVSWRLMKKIRHPLQLLTAASNQLMQGKLDARIEYASANEFGELATSFNTMAETIQTEMKCNENAAKLSGVMLREEEAQAFCRELLKALLEHTGSQVGAIYFLNQARTTFELFDSIGLDSGKRAAFSATTLEGEFGAALATRQIQRITDIPAGTRFTFPTVSGEFAPREILTIPVPADHRVIAVISLASLRTYDDAAMRLVKDIWSVLTARVNGVLAFREIRELAQRLEHQNRELDAQKRELTAQTDEMQQQNAELDMQKRQLDEANRLKSAFLSNMSHELRTPLNSVIALSGVLSRRLEKSIPKEEHGFLEVIERNGKNLLALINDVLDLSRIEAGREDIHVSRFSIRAIVNDIVAMLAPQAREKNIELKNLVGDDLPQISSDPDKCLHILQNLVANAVKFTAAGSVEISARKANGEIHVAVRDTGIGIAADQIVYIFDEFRQADETTSRRFGGTGLGLAIARKYAQLLGGSIAVESRQGKGSTFVLRLPLALPGADPAQESRQILPERAGEPTSAPSGQGYDILVVEDSEPAIIQLTDILARQGYRLHVARNGREALEQIEDNPPDAMILDLMMPEVDGFQVLKAIRGMERCARLPVLILTAKHVTREELSFLKGNHVHQLIQKGDVNKHELLAAVANMVRPPQEKPAPPARPRSGRPRPARPVVLVVEDNPDSMLSAKALLCEHYEVLEAADGLVGLEQARIHSPDIILMDIAMPAMDGVQALQEIRKDGALRHIPVIALTASAMKGDRETILAHGFDGYLSKPLDAELLNKTLHEALD